MRFSKTTQCFYPEDIEYPTLPADIVTVTQADYDLAMTRTQGETLDLSNGNLVIVPAPAPTLAQVQTSKITELTAAYQASIQLPVIYMATTFQADSYSQDLVTKCLSPGSVPTGFFWLDATNNQVPMTYAQLQGLAGVMLAQGQAAFIKLQTLKTQVRDPAATIATVQAIIW